MVALHNRRLRVKDLWPDGLWTWEDESRVHDEVLEALEAEGLSGSDLLFRHAREMERRRKVMPRLAERQEVMRRIYPPVKRAPSAVPFNPDELEAIWERFAMANDEVGQQIHRKAAAMLGREIEAAGNEAPSASQELTY